MVPFKYGATQAIQASATSQSLQLADGNVSAARLRLTNGGGGTLFFRIGTGVQAAIAALLALLAPVETAPATANSGGTIPGNAPTYYGVVTATNSAGETIASNELSIALTPIAVPTNGALTQTVAGALGAATYFVRSTWVTANGETLGATETSFAVSANNVLNVAAPASPPSGATGWNVYVSTATGTETKQNGATPIALGNAWVEPTTGLVAGTALPAGNTALTNLNTLTWNWNAVTGAAGYNVYVGTGAGAENLMQSVGAVATLTMTSLPATSKTPPVSNSTSIAGDVPILAGAFLDVEKPVGQDNVGVIAPTGTPTLYVTPLVYSTGVN